MIGMHFAVAADEERSIALAEKGAHDLVIESIRLVGRRTSAVVWHHYGAAEARVVLDFAVRAEVMPAENAKDLLAKLEEFAPAILITAEAEYEPAQRLEA